MIIPRLQLLLLVCLLGSSVPVLAEAPRPLLSQVLERLESEDELTVLKASLALPELVQKDDLRALLLSLKKARTDEARRAILGAVSSIGDPRAAKVVSNYIIEGTKPVRLAAIQTLGKLKHNWAVPTLTKLLVDKNGDLKSRFAAAVALGDLGTKEAEYALEQGIARVSEESLRFTAQQALEVLQDRRDTDSIDPINAAGSRDVKRYKGVRYQFYHPNVRARSGQLPRVFACFHDEILNWQPVFKKCVESAKLKGLAALTIHFDFLEFPEFGSFNLHGRRSDEFFLELVDYLAKEASVESREMYLYGEGAGGAFVERFAMAYPRRVTKAFAASSDFARPDSSKIFPGGLKSSPLAPDIKIDLYDFVKLDIKLVFVQGENVLWTAANFEEVLKTYAISKGITTRYEFTKGAGSYLSYSGWRDAQSYLFDLSAEDSARTRRRQRRERSKN